MIPWVLNMAWRDSRGRRRRLLLYTASIAVGISALTALRGLSRAMEKNVDAQAAMLMGADIEIEGTSPSTAHLVEILEASPLIARVEFRTPITRNNLTNREHFSLALRAAAP